MKELNLFQFSSNLDLPLFPFDKTNRYIKYTYVDSKIKT